MSPSPAPTHNEWVAHDTSAIGSPAPSGAWWSIGLTADHVVAVDAAAIAGRKAAGTTTAAASSAALAAKETRICRARTLLRSSS
jgi:hypothetical protein